MMKMICPNCGLQLKHNECPDCGFSSLQSSKTDLISSNLKLAGPLPENTEIGPGKRYIIKNEIGSGGMGRTYKAIDKVLNNKVCVIKEFDSDLGNLPERALEGARKNFETEANILATLRHQNMPSVWDYFKDYGRAYFAVDFIDGKHLANLTQGLTKPLAEGQLIDVGISICKVLSYVHGQNPPIIHRDIKPENIMFKNDDRYYLIDFGTAKNYKPDKNDTIAFGTEGYAAPEAKNKESQTRSDIYSLGMTLFTLATCKTPDKYVTGSFPLASSMNSKISDQLSRIINKAIEHLPRDRFNANEMEQALLVLKNENKICSWCGGNLPIDAKNCNFCGGTAGEIPGFTWEGIRGDKTYKGTRSYNIRLKGNAKWHLKGFGEIKAAPLVTEGKIFLPREPTLVY
jgi:serine/threonine protein kinase